MESLVKDIIYYILKYINVKESHIWLNIGDKDIYIYGNLIPSNLAEYERRSYLDTHFSYHNYMGATNRKKIRTLLMQEINKMLLFIGLSHYFYIGYGDTIYTLKIQVR